MSGLPRRGNQTAHNRTTSRPSLSEASLHVPTVLNSSAVPRAISYKNMPDRSLDSQSGTPSKHSKHTPPTSPRSRDGAPNDPFQAISRAIHNVKIRTGARLSALAAKQRYARSTARHRSVYARVAAITRAFFLFTLLVLSVSLLLDARQPRPDFGLRALHAFLRRTFSALRGGNARTRNSALQQALRHRPPASTTRHFGTGPWVIGVITDLDKESCRYQESHDTSMRVSPCGKANTWVSYFKRGVVKLGNPTHSAKFRDSGVAGSSMEWLDEIEMSGHGRLEVERQGFRRYGGRGMELSELEWFFGHLLAPDDRTGMLLEVMSPRGRLDAKSQEEFYGEPSKVAPSTFRRATLLDGPGHDETAFFKSEWMVVKDDELLVGGHGRSYTDPADGTVIKSDNPKWVKIVRKDFKVSRANWTENYNVIAKAAGVSFPGYLMHEAVLWSTERQEWVFLPRRRSKDPFDSRKNERRGWNVAIIASEDFKTISTVEIKGLADPSGLRGFSTAKFAPGTNDRVILAVRTVEIDSSAPTDAGRETASFLSAFDLSTGKMVLNEQRFSSKKFEGLVFL